MFGESWTASYSKRCSSIARILDAVFPRLPPTCCRAVAEIGLCSRLVLNECLAIWGAALRPRVVFVALRKEYSEDFSWPGESRNAPPTVGETLYDLIASRGWKGAKLWRKNANEVAPTIVGGSLKHGGPDLGPTRARLAWAALGVDGKGIADDAPNRGFSFGMPRRTIRMVARIQGFPDEWQFAGAKTRAYRQVGNAFPPPFAAAVAAKIRACLIAHRRSFRIA